MFFNNRELFACICMALLYKLGIFDLRLTNFPCKLWPHWRIMHSDRFSQHMMQVSSEVVPNQLDTFIIWNLHNGHFSLFLKAASSHFWQKTLCPQSRRKQLRFLFLHLMHNVSSSSWPFSTKTIDFVSDIFEGLFVIPVKWRC